ncbi:MAG: MAPEG family protein [Candidatus Binatia bacterium]|nr:MAPEG family protein [Candidatus Binatia bacterium]
MEAIPITGFYSGIMGLILLWLSIRIAATVRAKAEVGFGDAGVAEHTVIIRGRGNFIEYVPTILHYV